MPGPDLRVAFVRKTNIRLVQTTTIPTSQLSPITGIRKFEDRKKFQWKIVFEDGSEREFRNFKELRLFSNLSLRNLNKHVILTRSDRPVTLS